MPTPLDRATPSRVPFFAFASLVTAAAAWTIWGPSNMFPAEPDPTGDPETWTFSELKRWLEARNLYPSNTASHDDLVERVKANMRPPTRK